MGRILLTIVSVLLILRSIVATLQACQIRDCSGVRDVFDNVDCCAQRKDSNGACRQFVSGYDLFVETGKLNSASVDDQERFLFEGGDRLLTYAIRDATQQPARVSAGANSEMFFRRYIDWFAELPDDRLRALSNGGRVRSVLKFLGDALIAQQRQADIHNAYAFVFMTKGPSVFGPDAMALWEQSLRNTYGPANNSRNLPEVNAEWQEFANDLAEWANVPGMLKANLREHYVQQSERILGKPL